MCHSKTSLYFRNSVCARTIFAVAPYTQLQLQVSSHRNRVLNFILCNNLEPRTISTLPFLFFLYDLACIKLNESRIVMMSCHKQTYRSVFINFVCRFYLFVAINNIFFDFHSQPQNSLVTIDQKINRLLSIKQFINFIYRHYVGISRTDIPIYLICRQIHQRS